MLRTPQKFSRHILVSIFSAVCALAQTSTLSQIQDTVDTSSGAPFNGTVVITWTGTTSNSGTAPFNTTVTIANGILSVLLAPSTTITPPAYYQAVYNSNDGLTTWTQTWAVPPSPTPLTLSQVIVQNPVPTGGSGSGSGSGGGTSGQVQIDQVVGLTSDLSAINSSLSSINSVTQGLNLILSNLTNTVSNLSNTVGALTSTTNANFVDAETPAGSINGANTVFTLANAPVMPNALSLYRNGIVQRNGTDYTLLGLTITFSANEAPQTGDELLAYYRILGTGTLSSFVDAETPAGSTNGTNMSFSLANAPNPAASLRLFKNGALLQQNVDYTLANQTITFASTAVTPQVGDSLSAYYRITTPSQTPGTSVNRGEFAPARQGH